MPRPARIKASYFDGKSSLKHPVLLCVDANGNATLLNEASDGPALPPLPHCSRLQISDRVGDTARSIHLSSGGTLETLDNAAIDQLSEDWFSSRRTLAHRLEHNLALVWASIAGLLVGGALFVIYGIPAISQQITEWLPTSIDEQMAAQAVEQLDEYWFSPSELDAQRQDELQALFAELTAGSDRNFTLLFRSSEDIGANAFALPDGTIIFTDELINLAYLCVSKEHELDPELASDCTQTAGDDGETSRIIETSADAKAMIAAIMQHEIGHVAHRHTVQNTVRQAGLSALIVVLTGDVGTASSLILLAPTVLVQSQYSQEFETQADSYALEQMLARGEDPLAFAKIMSRMAVGRSDWIFQHGDGEDALSDDEEQPGIGERLSNVFSSHPSTRERIERFRRASAEFNTAN